MPEDMDISHTRHITSDNKKTVIPDSTIINYSGKEERRIDLKTGVTYDPETDEVKSVIKDTAQGNTLVLEKPMPAVRPGELPESSLIFHVRVLRRTADHWDA